MSLTWHSHWNGILGKCQQVAFVPTAEDRPKTRNRPCSWCGVLRRKTWEPTTGLSSFNWKLWKKYVGSVTPPSSWVYPLFLFAWSRVAAQEVPPELLKFRYWLTAWLVKQGYTQSLILRNTETASTHQSVSYRCRYLNAFPRCEPSTPGRPCCRFQGKSPEIIAFPGSEPF
jgi:hypothetical protein